MGKNHYKYWHNTGTIGTFGAAAASATVLGLSSEEYAHALSAAATFAAGLQQAFKSESLLKPLHAGRAAEAGVFAANLAAEGVTGAADILEGQFGMGIAMSDGIDWSNILNDTDSFTIKEMTFKNHACCGHTFAPIDGVLFLQEQHDINYKDINKIIISTYQAAIDAKFPQQRSARVEIHLNSGTKFEFLQPTRKGDPDMPLSDVELDNKFFELVSPILGSKQAIQSLDYIKSISKNSNMRDLIMG